jgi:hypothetical protein
MVPSTPWAPRVVASLLALLITGLGVRALLADITLRAPAPRREAVVYVQPPSSLRPTDPVLAPLAAPALALPAQKTDMEVVPRPTSSPRPSALVVRRAAPAASPEAAATATPTATAATAAAASAPAPDATERRPLDLSPDVLRAAARDSKPALRRMADASGRALGDEPASQAESMATSIAKAGKPDCISPNEGGSLLGIFVIAYAAMREQCR